MAQNNNKILTPIVCFVCHNTESINYVIDKNQYIIFVGNNTLDEKFLNNPKIIIARDLPYNIEHEPKLLTFTAWYAIIKNNLFKEYEFICILEYDCILDNNFFTNLHFVCCTNKYDIISFLATCSDFPTDINLNILKNFIRDKNSSFNYIQNSPWTSTTNYCIRRNILSDFVDWYYPDCLTIKTLDCKHFSWYHERIFFIYIIDKKVKLTYMGGLRHIQLNSHALNINN